MKRLDVGPYGKGKDQASARMDRGRIRRWPVWTGEESGVGPYGNKETALLLSFVQRFVQLEGVLRPRGQIFFLEG